MKFKLLISSLLCFAIITACSVKYSLGNVAKVPEDAETVTITTFENLTTQAPPTLSQTLTENYKDLVIAQSKLELVTRGGDLEFNTKITTYKVDIVGMSSDSDIAAENKLTIAVKVEYKNRKNEKDNFEATLSAYETFPGTANLIDVENELIASISDQLSQLIFDKAFGDW